MKIIADEKKIARQSRIGRIALIGSLVALFALLGVTLVGPQWGLITPANIGLFYGLYGVILVAAFGFSRIGMHYGNVYLSPTRPERVLRENLKGMDRKYALMLFTIPKADYVLVEPGGVTVMIMRNQPGPVSFKGGKWKRRENFLTMWLGREEPLGNPSAEADVAMRQISTMLAAKAPDIKVPIRALVAFTNPRATIDAEPAPLAVMRSDEIKDFLRGAGKLKELPTAVQRKMRDALGAPAIPAPQQQ